MKIAIIGAGAVGLGLGSCLAAAGADLRFVVRDAKRRDALRTRGFRRSGFFGDEDVDPGQFDICDSSQMLADGRDSHWMVCVKSTSSRSLARQLAGIWPRLEAASALPEAIVLCQNGWGNAEAFAQFLPARLIFNARVITGFVQADARSVEVTAHADAIHVGSLFGAEIRGLAPLCEAISAGGIPCELSHQIERDLWAKLLYNGLLNPLGALVGVPYGTLGERPRTRAVMDAVAHEIFSVLAASGYTTHWKSAEQYLQFFYDQLLPATCNHHSSMLHDLRAGRMTEIDAICGAVCEVAAKHGVDAPVNQALCDLIHVSESRDHGSAKKSATSSQE